MYSDRCHDTFPAVPGTWFAGKNNRLTNCICVVTYTYMLPQVGAVLEERSKIILITGAESGIGRTTAELMLKAGYYVVGADIKTNELSRPDYPNYYFVKTDLTDPAQIDELFETVYSRFKRLDVLLNCAGITSLDDVHEITPEKWDLMLDINLKAVFFCCRNALAIMEKQGHGKIVNISSNAGVAGGKAVGVHYSASKAAVIGLTKSLAKYAADFNINVNCVAPGPTATPMTEAWQSELYSSLIDAIPLKRFAQPLEIAEAIFYLSSEKSDFITGETLNINGGLVMN